VDRNRRNDVREKCEVTRQFVQDGKSKELIQVRSCLACMKHNVPFPQTDEAAFPRISIAAKTDGRTVFETLYINARTESVRRQRISIPNRTLTLISKIRHI